VFISGLDEEKNRQNECTQVAFCERAPPRSMLPSAMFLTQRKMNRSHP
jgi:hypothetical protein